MGFHLCWKWNTPVPRGSKLIYWEVFGRVNHGTGPASDVITYAIARCERQRSDLETGGSGDVRGTWCEVRFNRRRLSGHGAPPIRRRLGGHGARLLFGAMQSY